MGYRQKFGISLKYKEAARLLQLQLPFLQGSLFFLYACLPPCPSPKCPFDSHLLHILVLSPAHPDFSLMAFFFFPFIPSLFCQTRGIIAVTSRRSPGQGMRVMSPMPPTSQDPSSGPSNMVTPGRAQWHSQRTLHELGSGRFKKRGKEMQSTFNADDTCLRKNMG